MSHSGWGGKKKDELLRSPSERGPDTPALAYMATPGRGGWGGNCGQRAVWTLEPYRVILA